MRIYELAKELNMNSKELVEVAERELGVSVKNHMSSLSDLETIRLKKALNIGNEEKKQKVEKQEKKTPETKIDSKPKSAGRNAGQQQPGGVKKPDRPKQNQNQNQNNTRNNNQRNSNYKGGNAGGNNRGQGGQGGQGGGQDKKPGGNVRGGGGNAGSGQGHNRQNNQNNNNNSNNNNNASGNKNSNNNNNRNKNRNNKTNNNQKNDNQKNSNFKSQNNNRNTGKSNEKKPVQPKIKNIEIEEPIIVRELADKMSVPVSALISKLIVLGIMANMNQEIDFDTASLIAEEFKVNLIKREIVDELKEIEEAIERDDVDNDGDMVERSPIVTVMGHVDHGKTSLLDAIRNTAVTKHEAGGITQHIGASQVEINNKKITFLDTPGHEAFTSMRARGAKVTDIAILVVAADDGVMPQTVEAINHAKAAGVPIIVAVNKVDKEAANVDKVKQELAEQGVLSEDWGGDTIFVNVSAKQRMGIEELLEMILLVAEVQELKANPNRSAKGTIIEAKLDKGRGPVATVLVQKGTLKKGDMVLVGGTYGRVRALFNSKGKKIGLAGPSVPVEIVGLSETPLAGDTMIVMESEKDAKSIAEKRKNKIHLETMNTSSKVSLEDLFERIQKGEVKDLNIIIKADVSGSIEAIKQSLKKQSMDEVNVNPIHGGVGGINENDIMLASASNAIVIGFNVRPTASAMELAKREHVDVRTYNVIYNAIEDIKAAVKGMLAPQYKEVVLGRAEIRQTFKVPNIGLVAGVYVTNGKVTRKSKIRLLRDNIVVFEGEISSLKRFKDDASELNTGYEGGIGIDKYNDIKVGDVIEAYILEEISR